MKLIVACTHANFRVHFEKRPVAQSLKVQSNS